MLSYRSKNEVLMNPQKGERDEQIPLRHRATTHERRLLEISKRHLRSIKDEIDSGTIVDPAKVTEMEEGIADLESAYGEDRNARRE